MTKRVFQKIKDKLTKDHFLIDTITTYKVNNEYKYCRSICSYTIIGDEIKVQHKVWNGKGPDKWITETIHRKDIEDIRLIHINNPFSIVIKRRSKKRW